MPEFWWRRGNLHGCLLTPTFERGRFIANAYDTADGVDDVGVIFVVQMCECSNQATCDPISGECICAPGWSGVQCTERKLLSCRISARTILFLQQFPIYLTLYSRWYSQVLSEK